MKKQGMTQVVQVDEELARRVLEVVDVGLTSGMGSSATPGEMCVEAAVCYALGLPHGDRPTCVGHAVREYKIVLNDAAWSSPAARAKGMRRAAVAQLGSVHLDQVEFAQRIALETIRRVLPVALGAAELDEALIRACREAKDLDEGRDAARAAYATAYAAWAAGDAAGAAAWAARATGDAAGAAAWAARATVYAAWVAGNAARAAAWAARATVYAARAAAGDQTLTLAADMLVDVLVETGSEGSAWLGLCDGR